MRKLLLTTILPLILVGNVEAATFWVRTDGGTITQCTGQADAAYDGSGTGEACAVKDLRQIITHSYDSGSGTAGTTVVSAGDTIIVGDPGGTPGQFRMGYNPSDIWASCSSGYPYDCYLEAIPAGVNSSNRTKLYGRGYDTGCTGTKAQLWGSERAYRVLTLSSNVDVQCLDITDHSACIESGPVDGTVGGFPVKCERDTYPYGNWASIGVYADGATDVNLTNVDIHGLAHTGIFGYHNGDWNLTNVNIIANAFVGWDSDGPSSDDSYTGTTTLTNSKIEWNGCGEKYPLTTSNWSSSTDKHHCWSQDQGGFGDGIGLGDGSPGNWTFNNTSVSWNTSDGVDLLHGNGTGTVKFIRSRSEGNAGQAFKTSVGLSYVDHSFLIGNCGFFNGQSFTSTKSNSGATVAFNNCRANGDTVAFSNVTGGQKLYINNSTITSNGNIVFLSDGTGCNGSTVYKVDNTLIRGGTEFNDGSDTSDIYYPAGTDGAGAGSCGSLVLDIDNSLIYGGRDFTECSAGTNNQCDVNPLFTGTIRQGPTTYYTTPDYLDQLYLQVSSPAIGAGTNGLTYQNGSADYNNFTRTGLYDIGALEYGSVPTSGGGSGGGSTGSSGVSMGGVKIFLGGGKINVQ